MDERLLYLLLPAAGLALFAGGVVSWFRTRRFVSESFRVGGTVVGLEARTGGKGGPTYAPVVEFETREGMVRRFTDPVSSRPAGYSVGRRVEVLYHYRDHDRARLASTFRLYFTPLLLGFVGLIFAGVGSLVVLTVFLGEQGRW